MRTPDYLGIGARRFGRSAASALMKRGYSSRYKMKRSRAPAKARGKVRYGIAKRYVATAAVGSSNSNQLYFYELTDIARGVAINTRERDEIIAKGVNLRIDVRSTYVAADAPIFYNWAIVQFKTRKTDVTLDRVECGKDLFRGSGTERSVDFLLTPLGVNKRSFPINSDKYHVLARGEKMLSAATSKQAGVPTAFTIDKYVPINKHVTYDSNAASSATNPIVFLYWMTLHDINSVAETQASLTEEANSLVLHFRDVV